MTLLKMVALSILMILGLSALLVCSMLLFVEGPDGRPPAGPVATIGIAGLAVSSGSLWSLVRLNRSWLREFGAKFDQAPEELLARWTVDERLWKSFAEREYARSRSDLPLLSLTIGALVAVAFLFCGWSTWGLPAVGARAVGLGLGTALLCLLFGKLAASQQRRQRHRDRCVDIRLRRDGVRIDNRPVPWRYYGATLQAARLEPSSPDIPYAVFEAIVRIDTGRGSGSRLHRVAVPREVEGQVRQAVALLQAGA